MRLRLSAQLNNAAFRTEPVHVAEESLIGVTGGSYTELDADAVATLLVAAAKAVHDGARSGVLRDANGNSVGEWSIR